MADEIIITGREAASIVVDTSGIPAIVADFPVEQNLVADTVYVQGIPGSGGGDVSSVAGRTGAVVLSSVDLTDSTATGRSVLTAANSAAARTAIGAGTSNLSIGTTGTDAAAGNRQATTTAIGMVELATNAETTTGTDTTRAVTPAGLKAVADTKAPALGADDNYVTDAEKTKLANLSGVNTGDQDLSGYLTTSAAPELIRDTIGSTLVAGSNVTITPNDVNDTITIAASGGGSSVPATPLGHVAGRWFPWIGEGAGTVQLRTGGERIEQYITPVFATGGPCDQIDINVSNAGDGTMTLELALFTGAGVWIQNLPDVPLPAAGRVSAAVSITPPRGPLLIFSRLKLPLPAGFTNTPELGAFKPAGVPMTPIHWSGVFNTQEYYMSTGCRSGYNDWSGPVPPIPTVLSAVGFESYAPRISFRMA